MGGEKLAQWDPAKRRKVSINSSELISRTSEEMMDRKTRVHSKEETRKLRFENKLYDPLKTPKNKTPVKSPIYL